MTSYSFADSGRLDFPSQNKKRAVSHASGSCSTCTDPVGVGAFSVQVACVTG